MSRRTLLGGIALALLSSAQVLRADFTVALDAGALRVNGATSMPHIDNTDPHSSGSLILLIAANGDGTFDDSLTEGAYVAGNDIVIAATGFNESGGPNETVNIFNVAANVVIGDRLAIRWFPNITYQQYLNNTTPAPGEVFGTYSSRVANNSDNPDGDDPWTAPAQGAAIRLNFYTADSALRGTQAPAEGYALFSVSKPTPTPSPTPSPSATASSTPTATVSPSTTPSPSATTTPSPGTTPTPTATPSITPTAATQLLNLSAREVVGTGAEVTIGGFIVTGTENKTVLIRGLGPSLPFGANNLADPRLELHQSDSDQTLLYANNDWKDKQAPEIAATGIPPTNDLEAALIYSLPAKSLASGGAGYTAILAGNGGGSGQGLVELYDLDQTANSKLANISTRGFVGTGDNLLIGGFFPGPLGNAPLKVLIRALGPSLANQGVSGSLQNPVLELHDANGGAVVMNDDWKDAVSASEIEATLPPPDDRESAIITTLAPTNAGYTAVVRGANGSTGVALVEIYALQ